MCCFASTRSRSRSPCNRRMPNWPGSAKLSARAPRRSARHRNGWSRHKPSATTRANKSRASSSSLRRASMPKLARTKPRRRLIGRGRRPRGRGRARTRQARARTSGHGQSAIPRSARCCREGKARSPPHHGLSPYRWGGHQFAADPRSVRRCRPSGADFHRCARRLDQRQFPREQLGEHQARCTSRGGARCAPRPNLFRQGSKRGLGRIAGLDRSYDRAAEDWRADGARPQSAALHRQGQSGATTNTSRACVMARKPTWWFSAPTTPSSTRLEPSLFGSSPF